jgi:D-alanine-D-alanine ligase
MMPIAAKRDVKTVLLIADVHGGTGVELPHAQRRDLEKSSLQTVSAILRAVAELGLPAIHIRTLEELSERAARRHPGDLALSIFGGDRSRNRMALVPAICETFGMRFIGPDVYGRIVCQDKEVSKQLALQCGVLTPHYAVVRCEADLARVSPARFPMVVKPNLEGSSIGISQRCLVTDRDQMLEVARSILQEFTQPVLIEEFVGGAEVCFNVIESLGGPQWRLAEVKLTGQPSYFNDHLFTADIKAPWTNIDVIPLDGQLIQEDRLALQRLIAAVGTMGYCRVDGKLQDGRFHFLELTPDAWLDPSGAFALSFTKTGWSYVELLEQVLDSERASHPHQSSSG